MLGNIWTSYVKKGFYPYEWVDGNEKLNFECIPPLEAVHSQLKKKSVLYDDDDDEDDNEKKKTKSSSKRTTSTAIKFMMH